MEHGSADRRRGRRVSVEAPLLIRPSGEGMPTSFQQERTKNVSLAGAYFETAKGEGFAINVPVVVSVSVPIAETRQFPFTRLAGRGRVVRMFDLQPEGAVGHKRFGIAVEFGDDVTALTASPQTG